MRQIEHCPGKAELIEGIELIGRFFTSILIEAKFEPAANDNEGNALLAAKTNGVFHD